MYSSIVEIAQNREFLDGIEKGWTFNDGSNLNLLSALPSYSECAQYESTLRSRNEIVFDKIFYEPLGYYLIKSFLMLNNSDDKAVFVSDVKLYKTLTDPSARVHISKKIFSKYCTPVHQSHLRGVSVFDSVDHHQHSGGNSHDHLHEQSNTNEYDANRDISDYTEQSAHTDTYTLKRNDYYHQLQSTSHTNHGTQHPGYSQSPQPQQSPQLTNAIEVSGQCIEDCFADIYHHYSSELGIFDAILDLVLRDLRNHVFPAFMRSPLYKLYVQCICYNAGYSTSLTPSSFVTLRVLGRGAFGFVNACIKKNTGHIYAMKCINKKRVMATDSVETIMSERNFLSDMNSNFVTGLKYALQDADTLYLIIDLMVGGDMKFHLNKEGKFSVDRSRFYAAEVLLGLQHIHSKGIIYRDIKLENVLLDSSGHCKISDLGLAVRSTTKVRGYAGTPGYAAPEVCLQQSYGVCADFFSVGVMIYRFLSGRKPYQLRTANAKTDAGGANRKQAAGHGHRTVNELDKNVVEIEPEYPDRHFNPLARSLLKGLMAKNASYRLSDFDEIKQHPWFVEKIDFGLLESGHLVPPFVPNQDEINADSLRHIGRPPNDDKYKDVEMTASFEKSLAPFPYICNHAQQNEIVDVFKKIQKHYSFETFIHKITGDHGKLSVTELANIPSVEALNAYAAKIRDLKQENGLTAFIPKYYLQQTQPPQSSHAHQGRNQLTGHEDDEDDSDDAEDDDDDDEQEEEDEDDVGHHYDNVRNEKYNKISNEPSLSNEHPPAQRTNTSTKRAPKPNSKQNQQRSSYDCADDRGDGGMMESSVSHSNDVMDDINDDKHGKSSSKDLKHSLHGNEEEMKPINAGAAAGTLSTTRAPLSEDVKHIHIERIEKDAPKGGANQCMSCHIL